MPNGTVRNQITVDADGNFTYEYALLRLNRRAVVWESPSGPFTVSFPYGTPFGRANFYGAPRGPGGKRGRIHRVTSGPTRRRGVESRVYHYHVALLRKSRKGEGTIFLDSGCPGVQP